MRRPRFFLTGQDLQALWTCRNNQTVWQMQVVEPDLIHRIRSVLRLRIGDAMTVLSDDGCAYNCVIKDIEKQYALIELESTGTSAGDLPLKVSVAQSIIKGDRFEWSLEKLTELGVSEIVPLFAERGVVRAGGEAPEHRDERLDAKLRRWRTIVKEAAEQSERQSAPQVVAPMSTSDYLCAPAEGAGKHLRYICVERSKGSLLDSTLRSTFGSGATGGAHGGNRISTEVIADHISVVIGPEGGFTINEISEAENHGWQSVSLGSRILRSETAGITAMVQIASVLNS